MPSQHKSAVIDLTEDDATRDRPIPVSSQAPEQGFVSIITLFQDITPICSPNAIRQRIDTLKARIRTSWNAVWEDHNRNHSLYETTKADNADRKAEIKALHARLKDVEIDRDGFRLIDEKEQAMIIARRERRRRYKAKRAARNRAAVKAEVMGEGEDGEDRGREK